MLNLLLAAVGMKLAEVGGVWVFVSYRKRKRLLDGTDQDPISIPILDSLLAGQAGEPNKVEEIATKQIVKLTRTVVNTRLFELGVANVVNHNSKFRADEELDSDVSLET